MEVSGRMPVLFTICKILAILFAAAAIFLTTALLLPLGFAVEYRPDRFRVIAVYGPLRRTIWSHRLHRMTGVGKTESPKKEEKGAPSVSPHTAQPAESTPGPAAPGNSVQPVTPTASPQDESSEKTLPSQGLPEEEEELESGAVMGRLERMLELAAEDPRKLGNCVLQHMRWLQKHSFFKIHIRHLNVFWTVTGEDAAQTALMYGAEMTVFNTALALVQQTVRLQSDRLWLEPDFTGIRQEERRISCTVCASAVLMFHLLYRIWKDPLLQPASGREA